MTLQEQIQRQIVDDRAAGANHDGVEGIYGVGEADEPPVCGVCTMYIPWHAPSCPWREVSAVEDALEGAE